MTAKQCLACLGAVVLAALLLTHNGPTRADSCELKMGPYASPSAADLAVQQAKSIGYNVSGVWGEGAVISQAANQRYFFNVFYRC
jgi:uncharacterized protein YdeI (BOF family)